MKPDQLQLAEFVLDLQRAELRRGGEGVPIQPRAFRLLAYLVAHRDRVVSKGELLATIWPRETVTVSSLTQAVRAVRRILGDDGSNQRWISTVRGRGYQFVGPVERREHAHEAPCVDSNLLGREHELSCLRSMWDQQRRQGPRLIFLLGEPGMGKSTVLEAFLDELPPGQTALARISRVGGAPAYWPWYQVLVQLGRDPNEIFVDSSSGSSSTAQFRLFVRLAKALTSAHPHRVCLGLEDLQWWDASSLELLRFVLEETGVRVMMVATARSGELRSWPWQSARVRSLELRGLALVDVATVVRRVWMDASEEWIRTLHRRSGGNPYFAQELAQQGPTGVDSLPASLAGLLDRHIITRSKAELEILGMLAAFGRPARVSTVAVLMERTPESVEPIITGLLRDGLVRRSDGSVEVAHALLRERIEEHMEPAKRRAVHRRILLRIEQDAALDPIAVAPIRLHHARLASATERSAKVSLCALEAASHAEMRHAHHDAASYLQVALDAHPLADLTPGHNVSLLLRRAQALIWAGDRVAGEHTLRRAWDVAEASCPAWLPAVALGRGMVNITGRTHTSTRDDVVWMTKALDALDGARAQTRLELLSQLAIATFWMGDHREAATRLHQAQAIDAPRDSKASILYDLAAFVVGQLEHEQPSMSHISDVVVRAHRARVLDVELAARTLQVTEALEFGLAGELDRVVAECAALMASERHPLRGGMLDAALAHLRAPLPELLRVVEAYEQQLARTDNPNHAGLSFLHRFFVERERGRLGELHGAIAEGRRQHPRTALWQVASVIIASEEDAPARYQALLDALFEHHHPQDRELLGPSCWCLLALSVGHLLSIERVEQLLSALRPLVNRHAVLGFPGVYVGPMTQALARLELRADNPTQALAYARSAHQSMVALRACRPLVEGLIILAECLAASGEAQEARVRARQALELADRAHFTRLGCVAQALTKRDIHSESSPR